MGTVFSGTPSIISMPSGTKGRNEDINVSIAIGGGRAQKMLLLGPDTVKQPFRTQFDVAIDGSEYVIAAGKGIGSYDFKVLEGPFTCAEFATYQSILEKLDEFAKTVDDRRITMTLLNGNSQASKVTESVFKGIINNVTTTTTVYEGGEKVIVSNISALGSWQK